MSFQFKFGDFRFQPLNFKAVGLERSKTSESDTLLWYAASPEETKRGSAKGIRKGKNDPFCRWGNKPHSKMLKTNDLSNILKG